MICPLQVRGLAVEDLAAAEHLYRQAKSSGAGTWVEFYGTGTGRCSSRIPGLGSGLRRNDGSAFGRRRARPASHLKHLSSFERSTPGDPSLRSG